MQLKFYVYVHVYVCVWVCACVFARVCARNRKIDIYNQVGAVYFGNGEEARSISWFEKSVGIIDIYVYMNCTHSCSV